MMEAHYDKIKTKSKQGQIQLEIAEHKEYPIRTNRKPNDTCLICIHYESRYTFDKTLMSIEKLDQNGVISHHCTVLQRGLKDTELERATTCTHFTTIERKHQPQPKRPPVT